MKTPHHLYLALGVFVALILSVGVGAALWQLNLIEQQGVKTGTEIALTSHLINQALKGTHANGDDGLLVLTRTELQNLNGATNALKQTLQATNEIAKSQESRAKQLSDAGIIVVQNGGTAVAKLGTAVDELTATMTDVHQNTLPKLNAGIDDLNGLVSDLRPTAKASTTLITSATGTIDALHGTVDTANRLLADPQFPIIISNFASTSKHLDGTAANGERLTGEIADMFKPAPKGTFFENLAITAARYAAGPVAGSLVTHFWPQRVTITSPVQIGK